MKDAILGTGLVYAPDTWVRVQARLDEYAEDWVTQHTEACEATSVRHEQPQEDMDLRMECLRGRRIELREVVEVLVRADATTVEEAVDLVSDLPELSRCDDVEALQAELPPPEDPRVADQVMALRERIVHVRAMAEAAQGLAQAEEIAEQAEALGYAPLLAEALLLRSRRQAAVGRYAEAEQDAEQAYFLAQEHGHDALAADAADHLLYYVGMFQNRLEASLQWSKTALALAKGRRFEPGVEARALFDIGWVLHHWQEDEEALTYFQDALAIWEEASGSHHRFVADSLNAIGSVLSTQGKLEPALTHHQRAVAIEEQTLGPRHPDVARGLVSVGKVLGKQGRHDEAMAHYQRAMTIFEDVFGERSTPVAALLVDIGSLRHEQGKLSEALTHYQRALAISEQPTVLHQIGRVLREQGKLPESLTQYQRALAISEKTPGSGGLPFVAISLDEIGDVLLAQGKLSEALTHYQRALAIREELLGSRHSNVAMSLGRISTVLIEQGNSEDALVNAQRMLAILKETVGPRHPSVAGTLAFIGGLRADQGEHDGARSYFQRSLALVEDTSGPRHPDVARPLIGLAAVALETHDHDTAIEHAERALSIGEASEASPELLAEARFVLARALWADRSQRARAHALAEQAREAYVALGDVAKDELAEARAWLAKHPAP